MTRGAIVYCMHCIVCIVLYALYALYTRVFGRGGDSFLSSNDPSEPDIFPIDLNVYYTSKTKITVIMNLFSFYFAQ